VPEWKAARYPAKVDEKYKIRIVVEVIQNGPTNKPLDGVLGESADRRDLGFRLGRQGRGLVGRLLPSSDRGLVLYPRHRIGRSIRYSITCVSPWEQFLKLIQ
jgi:hypothetical protein